LLHSHRDTRFITPSLISPPRRALLTSMIQLTSGKIVQGAENHSFDPNPLNQVAATFGLPVLTRDANFLDILHLGRCLDCFDPFSNSRR